MAEGYSTHDAELMIVAAEADADREHGEKLSPREWISRNLFNSIMNSIITVVFGALLIVALILSVDWVIVADFRIVRVNLRIFMVGQFPSDELWRPWASGFVLVSAVGFVSGALAKNAYESAIEKDLPTHRPTWFQLGRRFWAIITVTILFVSFARTVLPYIGLTVAFILVVVCREIGWRVNAAVRDRAVYVGAVLFVISMLVIAGTSKLGGFAIGLIAAIWIMSELRRRDARSGFRGFVTRWGMPLAAGLAMFLVTPIIGFDGFGWDQWGGLHVTLFVSVLGITLGLPVGIVLAVARKSNLPVVKTAAVIFIEFVRGVPLISLLLFSDLMLPLFLPVGASRPADLTLAVVMITAFSSAYIAEIVRGGLQSVPKGQTEAAQASGMSAGAIQRLIVLPQALRAVIPAMVGQFIALFKDTTLLSIIGVLEFLRVTDTSNSQPEFSGRGLSPVTYVFVGVGYWAFAYTMSKESRRLETKLGVGVR
jgi:general L-amino acid transport system permease protein